MTKREFLDKLKKALANDLSGNVIRDNVDYYNDYITEEVRKGRKESEVIEELGDPWAIAKNIITSEEIKASGFDKYYIDHTLAIWPQAASGEPFSASQFQSTGDTITDLYEDMAAEQKARLTYDNILRLVKDPEIADPIRFLREREIVHFQRFGEALRKVQDERDSRNFYAFNPQIDKKSC